MADGRQILNEDGLMFINSDGEADICETCCCACPTDCTSCGVSTARNAVITGFTDICCACFNDTVAITNTGTGCAWSGFYSAASPAFCAGEINLSCSTDSVGPFWTLTLDLITLDQQETCSTNVQEYEGFLRRCEPDSTTDNCGGGTYWMNVISADQCEGSDNVIKVVVANLP